MWWFVRVRRAELLRGCCAKWLGAAHFGRRGWPDTAMGPISKYRDTVRQFVLQVALNLEARVRALIPSG